MNKLLRNKRKLCRVLLALAVIMVFAAVFAMPAMAEVGFSISRIPGPQRKRPPPSPPRLPPAARWDLKPLPPELP